MPDPVTSESKVVDVVVLSVVVEDAPEYATVE